jgi:hypothetical protein
MTCGCPIKEHAPLAGLVARLRDDYERGYLSRRDACTVTFGALDAWPTAWERARAKRKRESDELEAMLKTMGALK